MGDAGFGAVFLGQLWESWHFRGQSGHLGVGSQNNNTLVVTMKTIAIGNIRPENL